MKAIFSTFKGLSIQTKSMVYLMWIYYVGSIVATTFVNIYVFKVQESYFDVLVFNLIVFLVLGFCFIFFGLLFAKIQKDVKYMYYLGYIFLFLSFSVFLFSGNSIFMIYVHGCLYGAGLGIYWNAVHSQELKNISDSQRDFYSSSISAGSNLIGVIVPLAISALFFLGAIFAFDGYMVLFFLIPCIYASSLFFIKDIPCYIPENINFGKVIQSIELKKRLFANLYLFTSGAKHSFIKAAIAVSAIILLKNEVNIGLLNGILSFLSAYVVVHLGLKRKTEKRFHSFVYFAFFWAILHIFFALFFDFWTFIFFSIGTLFAYPLYRSVAHTYDLQIMDNNEGKDFYPTMLGREIVLLISRMISILLLLSLLTIFPQEFVLRFSFAFVGILFFGEIVSIYFWRKYEKDT